MLRLHLAVLILFSLNACGYSDSTSDSTDDVKQDAAPSGAGASEGAGAGVPALRPVDGLVINRGAKVELRCITSTPDINVVWFRNDKELNDEKKYSFNHENKSMTVLDAGLADLGVYQCSTENDDTKINVTLYSVPFVREQKSINTSPTYDVTLDCRASGLPTPVVTWFGSSDILPSPLQIIPDGKRFVINNSTAINGELVISNLTYDDYKMYTCMASNVYGSINATILVRVKSQWRSVWPISGIIIQLIILAIIIFFYERKKKQEMEVEKKREAEFNKTHPVDGGLRQRKSN